MGVLVSFVIPTYNRCDMVYELVKEILTIKREDINVVVTDNNSTDNTFEKLGTICDKRLKIYRNETNVGAINNMVKAVFHASGKYAFYINDRDSIIMENLPPVFDLLEKGEYAYVVARNRMEGEKITVYKSGYESLVHHQLCTHPTGMIFNCEILRKQYKPEEFYKYAYTCYSPDFMARCCMLQQKTAIYENMICKKPESVFLASAQSRANPVGNERDFHKHPYQLFEQMKETYQQIFCDLVPDIPDKERKNLSWYVLKYFYKEIFHYKRIKLDVVLTSHYNLTLEKVGIIQMEKYVLEYYHNTLSFLKTGGFPTKSISEWKRKKVYLLLYCVFANFRANKAVSN